MQIIRLSQTEDRIAWLEGRRSVITGTKAKGAMPLKRGQDTRSAGFWRLVAENLAIAKDGEKDHERGQRLENEALQRFIDVHGLNLDLNPGYWVSDENDKIAVSPDGAMPGDNPTYAVEVKCLDSHNHLKAIVKDRTSKGDGYNPLNSLTIDAKNDFKYQALQYFVVNEELETLYFVLYDDRMAYEHLMEYVITINREEVEEEINNQKKEEENILSEVKALVRILKDESS